MADGNAPSGAPRHDRGAERATLGEIFLEPPMLRVVSALLHPEDFYVPAFGLVFAAMLAVDAAGQPIDTLTVAARLESLGHLAGAGGADGLANLMHSVGSAANIEEHARIVGRLARVRRVENAARVILESARNPKVGVDELEERAVSAMADATKQREVREPSEMIDLAERFYGRVVEIAKAKERGNAKITGLETGITALDELTGGFHPGQLIIVAARPAMGKTSLGQKMIRACAERAGKPALFFSLEMPEDEVYGRMVCEEADIDAMDLKRGDVTQEMLTKFAAANNRLAMLSIRIDDDGRVTAHDIRARALRAHMKEPLGMIAIDYLQKVKPPRGRRSDSREREVSEIGEALKELAKDLKIPVVAMAQLNRDCEDRPDKRPMLSDVRESGGLEAEADVVLLLYRAEYYQALRRDWNAGIAEIEIAKQRAGGTDVVVVGFDRQRTAFRNLDDETIDRFTTARDGERSGRKGSR